jgi:hypothetical protein
VLSYFRLRALTSYPEDDICFIFRREVTEVSSYSCLILAFCLPSAALAAAAHAESLQLWYRDLWAIFSYPNKILQLHSDVFRLRCTET